MLGKLDEKFEPLTHLAIGTPITALVEVYGADPLVLNQVEVDLELRKSGEESILAREEATVSDTDLVRRKAAAGQFTTTDFASGIYEVSAIIRNGAARVGIVSRTIALKMP